LLRRDQVEDWIRKHNEGSTGYVTIALPEGIRSVFDKKSFTFQLNRKISGPVVGSTAKFLEYGSKSGWVSRVPTRLGSVLDRLRDLSEHLCMRYPWQKAQASLFVLTGTLAYIKKGKIADYRKKLTRMNSPRSYLIRSGQRSAT
jgi:hypothetical protein